MQKVPPVVAKTTVSADLLQSLEIFTEFIFQLVRCNLRELAILNVFLSVQEPIRDFVLAGVGHDSDQFLNLEKLRYTTKLIEAGEGCYLFITQFSSTLGDFDVSLLQHNVGVSPTDTFDGGDGKHNFDPSINVCVKDTQNMLELLWYDQRLEARNPK